MFEEGNLLFFRPFLFKNGAESQDKFFLVLKKLDGDILLASLPTSKDHVPSDLEVKHGCLNIPERIPFYIGRTGRMSERCRLFLWKTKFFS